MTMISRGGRNLAQKRTMKNAGNEKTLESIYKNGKICFQRGDGAMSVPGITLYTTI